MIFFANLWDVLLELSPWLLLGALVSAGLHYVVPVGFVHRQLNGRWGVVKAVLLGVPLPLCSCGVIPAGIGLKRDGASDGSAVGFLVATPQTGVDSILVSASFLGWPFALWKVLAALVTGVVSGWLTDAVSESSEAVVPPPVSGGRRTVAEAAEHGVDVVRGVWRWLVFGIVVSALITTVLPPDAFASISAQGAVLAFALVLAISVPLYVCATASVPIAAALVASGMPTGAALVFLMAGPATNVATLGAVYRTFGGKTVGVYLGTIVGGSVAFGVAYEQLFGALVATSSAAHVHTTWWAIAATVVLLALLAWYAVEDIRSALATRAAAQSTQKPISVDVSGMTCNGCANRLQRVLLATEGVDSAVVSFEDGTAVVTGLLDSSGIVDVVRGAGFEPA